MVDPAQPESTEILHQIPRPVFISYARRDFRLAYRVAWECILTDAEKRLLKDKGDSIHKIVTLDMPPPEQIPLDMKLDWMHHVTSTSDHFAVPEGTPGYQDGWAPGMPGWMFGIAGEMIQAKSMVVIITPHSGASPAVAKEVEAFSVFPDKQTWLVSINKAPAPSAFFELPNLHTAVARIDMDAVLHKVLQAAAEFEAQQQWLKARRLYLEAINLSASREKYDQSEALRLTVRKGKIEIDLGWRDKAVESFRIALDKLEPGRHAERAVLLYNLGQAHMTDAHDEGMQRRPPRILAAARAAWTETRQILDTRAHALQASSWFDPAAFRSRVETALEWLDEIEARLDPGLGETDQDAAAADPLSQYSEAAGAGDAEAQFQLGRAHMGGSGIGRDDIASARRLLDAARQAHPAAQFWVGFGYETELGFPRNDDKALRWYDKAAAQGFALAQYRLGRMYADGRGTDQNHGVAVGWFRKAAAQGHAGAQKELGVCCREGLGGGQDIGQALHWLAKAAEQDILPAQLMLGLINQRGLGIEADVARAEAWYHRAALQGSAMAQNALGVICQDQPEREEEMVRWYTRAAMQGHAEAEFNLGWLFQNGLGVDHDPTAAAHWYRRSARRGNAGAQSNLGFLYRTGTGVPLDHAQAASWYRKAADQGDAIAQWSMGMLYLNGHGVEQSSTEAARWIHAAARQGHAPAQNTMGEMAADGVGVDRSGEAALGWFRLAAEQGNARGQYNLGLSLGQGRGVERDPKEGVRWLQRAARQELKPAIEMLAKLGIARIAHSAGARPSPDAAVSGRHLLWILHRFVSRLEDNRGLQGQVCVGLRTTENQYLIWQATFGDQVAAGFLEEWPEAADATLFIGEADALSVLTGNGIPQQPTLFSIDGDRQLVEGLFEILSNLS